jgi:GntR family transcriptional regulator, hexuronate regulon transcriptional repressor
MPIWAPQIAMKDPPMTRSPVPTQTPPPSQGDRLYQSVARRIVEAIAAGQYPVGERLPAERELAVDFGVSRPTVREAIIALEVQGLVEVRVGSGAYVLALPGNTALGFGISAFELTEARLLFEGESAALAASQISDEELATLERLLVEMDRENRQGDGLTESSDREFHLTIARATRNAAIVRTIGDLWDLRSTSPEAALVYSRARAADVKPVVDEHVAVVAALRTRDPKKARAAMRTHLSAVMDHLLFALEEKAIEDARKAVRFTRERYGRSTKL